MALASSPRCLQAHSFGGSVSSLRKPPLFPTSGGKQEILWLFPQRKYLDARIRFIKKCWLCLRKAIEKQKNSWVGIMNLKEYLVEVTDTLPEFKPVCRASQNKVKY